ncbi:hypothetical protein [Nocardiopsis sp. NRRL B-16309]|uniref:hypothetical protein n=1 Tax=Nocardiopsis sp. NRRL B-16309 TaxID=1519494 RepID=UPI0012E215C6|nr:hypothetical protein [Nocardiopsis sp. NRRL B-16309]
MAISKGASFGRGKVLRNRWTAAFGILVSFLFLLFWLAWAMEESLDPDPIGRGSIWFLSLFFPLVWWFLLKASFFTNIKIDENGVIVRNFFSKTVIPAGKISGVTWEGGVDVITSDGSKYWCFNLGGSLIGAMFGFPTNRRCAREIEAFLNARKIENRGGAGGDVRFGAHLNIVFLVSSVLVSYSSLRLLDFFL